MRTIASGVLCYFNTLKYYFIYFSASLFNIPYITFFIILPFYLNIISLFVIILILFLLFFVPNAPNSSYVWKSLGVVWMKCVLSDMIQNSSLIIQNWWDPRKIFCLDSITWFWSSYFDDSITQKTE